MTWIRLLQAGGCLLRTSVFTGPHRDEGERFTGYYPNCRQIDEAGRLPPIRELYFGTDYPQPGPDSQ